MRALWSYDPTFSPLSPTSGAIDDLVDPPLKADDRIEIVHEKKPIRARRLMLSALGGFLDLRGEFPDPGIIGWTHRATLGRDPWSESHLRVESIDPWTIRLDGRR